MISQTTIWDIPNWSSDFGCPKSTFWFRTNVGPKSNFVPNCNLAYPKSWFGALSQIEFGHYPKSQFQISQITIWCIVIWYTIPNYDLVYHPKLWFGALSQIMIWCIIPNHDLVQSQIAIWCIIPKYIRKWSFWYKMPIQKKLLFYKSLYL